MEVARTKEAMKNVLGDKTDFIKAGGINVFSGGLKTADPSLSFVANKLLMSGFSMLSSGKMSEHNDNDRNRSAQYSRRQSQFEY